MPVARVQFGKQPAGEVARQKKFLFFHRGLQQIAEANNANENRDDVKIVEHGGIIANARGKSTLPAQPSRLNSVGTARCAVHSAERSVRRCQRTFKIRRLYHLRSALHSVTGGDGAARHPYQ